ncbi:AAA family ATPase [Bacillus sp. RAR_GA_16]|uniref:AAA family ATPase n=1 Tax=Bacillus sp. RAR_GA_16 TaxID=2876774 RepID=UPI001CC9CAA3|nr:SMC family ATPase [Bacillus sp. RAR_GA_16]MCA0172369.1 SMC family ATPase [Bacillus sp. RAR_GA_16]
MRPITLSVSGLHSFREKQEIDFETLCQGGIFGIFGPTGSGKSSLLDAMTLALYGKVERATNNTQGIMNHAEDTLSVSFTFALSDLSYRVERTYKRSGDVSIRSANSRLIEIGEENTVLADKDRDVSQRIQEILGLTIDDFTRAVVLPQGKFAEFLSLKGTERRQMLQRLFQLEKYGDQFNRRLRARVDEKKHQLNEVTAEQTGLGDASKEFLKEAKEAVNTADQAAQKAKEDLLLAEKEKEQVIEIWNLQQQLVDLQTKKTSLAQGQDEINALEEKITQATAAAQIKPYLDAVEATEKEVQDAKLRFEETKRVLSEMKSLYQSSKNNYEDKRTKKEKEEPLLIKQLNDLERGLALESEINQVSNQLKDREEQSSSHDQKAKVVEEETTKAQQDLKKARTLQSDLNDELSNLQVTPEKRKKMGRAQSLKQEFQSLNKQSESIRGEEEKQISEQKRLHPVYEELEKDVEQLRERYIGYYQAVFSIYHAVSSHKLTLEQRIRTVQEDIALGQRKLEESRTHAIAIRLAKGLEDGDACPVCGATEHVDLADGDDQTEEINELLHQKEQTRERLKDMLQSANQLQYQLEQTSDTMTAQEDLTLVQKDDLAEVKRNLSAEELMTEMKSLTQDFRELEEKIKHTGKNMQEKQSKVTEYRYQLTQIQKDLDSKNEKRTSLKKEMESIEGTIQKEISLSIEEIKAEMNHIEKMDQQANVIRDRLAKSGPYIEAKEQHVQELQEKMQQHSVRKVELTSAIQQLSEQIHKAKAEYKTLVGDTTAQEGLSQVKELLNAIRQAEKNALEQFQQAEERYQQAERRAAADENYYSDAQLRLKKAVETYESAEGDSIFENRSQIRDAEVPREQKISWEKCVETYRQEWIQTAYSINEVNEKLAGRGISEDSYKETINHAEQAGLVREETLSRFAAAQHHLEDVTKRHERYMDLETLRKSVSEDLEKLGKLQTVFRGNSFVEFIASEQLEQVSLDASQKLGDLTSQRYAIEVDSGGGFLIRDDANGGVKRPVSTLSGGETFLTSLALALALSGQIQLRGAHPLQFFFLDEGFGTLDESLLDTVITALEKLQNESLSVGVISHVPELRARLPRKVIVSPSEPSGRGSRIELETL